MGQKKTISQKHQKTSNSQKICRRFFQATRFVTTFSLDHPIIIPPLGHPNTARPAGARCAPARAVPSVGHWNFFVGHLQCQISASTATVFVVCFFKGKVNYSSLIYLFLGGMILKYTVYHIGDHGWSWIIQLFHQSPTWKVILNPKSIHCMQVSLSACPSEYSARKCLGIASQMDPLFLSCWITPLSSLYEPSKFGGYMMLHDSGPIPYSRIIVNKCQQVERERERDYMKPWYLPWPNLGMSPSNEKAERFQMKLTQIMGLRTRGCQLLTNQAQKPRQMNCPLLYTSATQGDTACLISKGHRKHSSIDMHWCWCTLKYVYL